MFREIKLMITKSWFVKYFYVTSKWTHFLVFLVLFNWLKHKRRHTLNTTVQFSGNFMSPFSAFQVLKATTMTSVMFLQDLKSKNSQVDPNIVKQCTFGTVLCCVPRPWLCCPVQCIGCAIARHRHRHHITASHLHPKISADVSKARSAEKPLEHHQHAWDSWKHGIFMSL